ncbi:hypothetical protein MTO96_042295 [Rhipicephalus appendiculatus]
MLPKRGGKALPNRPPGPPTNFESSDKSTSHETRAHSEKSDAPARGKPAPRCEASGRAGYRESETVDEPSGDDPYAREAACPSTSRTFRKSLEACEPTASGEGALSSTDPSRRKGSEVSGSQSGGEPRKRSEASHVPRNAASGHPVTREPKTRSTGFGQLADDGTGTPWVQNAGRSAKHQPTRPPDGSGQSTDDQPRAVHGPTWPTADDRSRLSRGRLSQYT